jgi:hypothetical protein
LKYLYFEGILTGAAPDAAYLSSAVNTSKSSGVDLVYRYNTIINAPSGDNYTTEIHVAASDTAYMSNNADGLPNGILGEITENNVLKLPAVHSTLASLLKFPSLVPEK